MSQFDRLSREAARVFLEQKIRTAMGYMAEAQAFAAQHGLSLSLNLVVDPLAERTPEEWKSQAQEEYEDDPEYYRTRHPMQGVSRAELEREASEWSASGLCSTDTDGLEYIDGYYYGRDD